MRRELVHPRLLETLHRFYNSAVTIKRYLIESPDSFGQPNPTWSNLTDHVDLACSLAPKGGQEVKMADMTIAISTHTISISGYHPTITPTMRAVVGSQTFDILSVETDSRLKTTRLITQVVS